MLIPRSLIAESEARFKKAKVESARLNKQLGDGPLDLSPERRKQRYRTLLALSGNPTIAEMSLERIINGNDLDSINYLAKGTLVSHSICRIQLKDARANLIGCETGLGNPGAHHIREARLLLERLLDLRGRRLLGGEAWRQRTCHQQCNPHLRRFLPRAQNFRLANLAPN